MNIILHAGLLIGWLCTASQSTEPVQEEVQTNREARPLHSPQEEEGFVFAIIGDRTGGPAEGIKVLEEAVDDMALFDPDLVMTVGDMIQGYNTRGPWMNQMREFRGVMDRLTMPWYPVAGNHDVYWRGPDAPENEHEGHYEEHFGPLWYSFMHKNSCFIILYSDEADPETGIRNFSRPQSQRMSPEQFQWLRATLADASDADHVFCFLHHPRWLGGNYGDDWNKVHDLLVDAGNVSAVFAGHIHRMRYDPDDGIEYFALATTGGGQSSVSPEAGFLHHFNIVTVRTDGVWIATVPVGEVIDPREITGHVSQQVRLLSQQKPVMDSKIVLEPDGAVDSELLVQVHNPSGMKAEFELIPDCEDSNWFFSPDHRHAILQPGDRRELAFKVTRIPGRIDASFRWPVMQMRVDALGEKARYPLATVETPIPMRIRMKRPEPSSSSIRLDGVGDAIVVPSDQVNLPQGPLTVEAWLKADAFSERVGLVAKSESSEYCIFVSNGIPLFEVHLDGAYRVARADDLRLRTGRWYHLAGVYDGSEVRLYVDGRLVSSSPCSGTRTLNGLPLVIGGDVDAAGHPTSFFQGEIDEVRLSIGARYTGDSFEPARRHQPDDDAVVLLHFDEVSGRLTHLDGRRDNAARLHGDPELVSSDRP